MIKQLFWLTNTVINKCIQFSTQNIFIYREDPENSKGLSVKIYFYYTVVWMFASVILLFIYLPNSKNKLLVPEAFTCISAL